MYPEKKTHSLDSYTRTDHSGDCEEGQEDWESSSAGSRRDAHPLEPKDREPQDTASPHNPVEHLWRYIPP